MPLGGARFTTGIITIEGEKMESKTGTRIILVSGKAGTLKQKTSLKN